MMHIRASMPRKGGSSFYRDKNDYTKFCVTLCGEPITDKDTDFAFAGTKKFRAAIADWDVCVRCLAAREVAK